MIIVSVIDKLAAVAKPKDATQTTDVLLGRRNTVIYDGYNCNIFPLLSLFFIGKIVLLFLAYNVRCKSV